HQHRRRRPFHASCAAPGWRIRGRASRQSYSRPNRCRRRLRSASPLMTDHLIEPCGGQLVNLLVADEATAELAAYAAKLPSLQLSERTLCDLELLATGAFSPLDRFMGEADHQRVLDELRLAKGQLFPMPIALPVEADDAPRLDADVALRTPNNDLLAILTVDEIYPWDRDEVADKAFGTRDLRHPLVVEMRRWGQLNVSGRLQVLRLPAR